MPGIDDAATSSMELLVINFIFSRICFKSYELIIGDNNQNLDLVNSDSIVLKKQEYLSNSIYN